MSIPYFYVIRHIKSNRKYAGCKWARDANPETFMKEGGYKTSSSRVLDIIANEGLKSFEIDLLIEEKDINMTVYNFETRWLNDHDCKNSNEWINQHNNSNRLGKTEITDELREKRSKNRKVWLEDEENYIWLTDKLKSYWTEERKQTHSKRMSGENNPFYGKTHSDETIAKLKTKLKGRKVWNKGKTKNDDETAMMHSIRMKTNNPMKNMSKERIKEINRKKSEKFKGRKWFHDPSSGKRSFCFPEDCPEGYVKGMG